MQALSKVSPTDQIVNWRDVSASIMSPDVRVCLLSVRLSIDFIPIILGNYTPETPYIGYSPKDLPSSYEKFESSLLTGLFLQHDGTWRPKGEAHRPQLSDTYSGLLVSRYICLLSER
jgi:hypothetical protein